MKCAHCPISAGHPCPGERAPPVCARMDPSDSGYQPGFRVAIEESSRQLANPAAYPHLAAQAVNLAASLWAWAVDGFRIADEAEQARRRAICAGCPQWDAGPRRCRICGCQTDAKIALRSAHCPLSEPKW